jgi:hypothetical protein
MTKDTHPTNHELGESPSFIKQAARTLALEHRHLSPSTARKILLYLYHHRTATPWQQRQAKLLHHSKVNTIRRSSMSTLLSSDRF